MLDVFDNVWRDTVARVAPPYTQAGSWRSYGQLRKTTWNLSKHCVWLLSSERINGQRAKTSKKTMRERIPPLQNSKKGTKSGRLRRPLCVRDFASFGRVERRSRIIFLEVFARWPLFLSDDNTKNHKKTFFISDLKPIPFD